jgi:hypothetical protein
VPGPPQGRVHEAERKDQLKKVKREKKPVGAGDGRRGLDNVVMWTHQFIDVALVDVAGLSDFL